MMLHVPIIQCNSGVQVFVHSVFARLYGRAMNTVTVGNDGIHPFDGQLSFFY